jgi:Protein of unknown function (DUF3631)
MRGCTYHQLGASNRTTAKCEPNLAASETDMTKKRFSEPAGLPAEIIREVATNAPRFHEWCLAHVEKKFEYYGEAVGAVLGARPHTAEYLADQVRKDGLEATALDVDQWFEDLQQLGFIACVKAGEAGTGILALACGKAEGGIEPLPYYFAAAVEQAMNRMAHPESIFLLQDIWEAFEATGDSLGRITSAKLAAALAAMEDRPWARWLGGAEINAIALAHLLKPFGIWPRTFRFANGSRGKGYDRKQFLKAWESSASGRK